MPRIAALLLASAAALAAAADAPALTVAANSAGFSVSLDGALWYSGPAPALCMNGAVTTLTYQSQTAANGSDTFGAFTAATQSWGTSAASPALMTTTFKSYAASPALAVLTAAFPAGMSVSGCGGNTALSTFWPSIDTGAGVAGSNGHLSWYQYALGVTESVRGLGNLTTGKLDCGPVISFDPASGSSSGGKGAALVWSTLDNHKIVTQNTRPAAASDSDSSSTAPTASASPYYSLGLSAAIPSIPPGWSYSILLSASYGGPTAATYAWGKAQQVWAGTTRLPSVSLSNIGYYTDDGAYYYVWEAFGIPWPSTIRPWSAQDGLVAIKEQLWQAGVPVAYMQLDDWWYQGPFYFGNVKAIVNWTASTVPRLFPDGLPAFSDKLGLDIQLYTPFWSVNYSSPYNMTPSTQFGGTKLVVPADSYAFFSDLFDDGSAQTNGRFKVYEIDFLDDNFVSNAAMFETVYSADQWYKGMADAAYERGVTIQYCLPSATDMLQALAYPAVVQARASADYVNLVSNAQQFGGSSLLMGALAIAPSKDTLWTASPQPATYSDTIQNGKYTTQPHVELDAVLATLSLGPVGISDGINQTDVGLISQSFMSATDGTLLRPSRPASWVDSVFLNRSLGLPWLDVRSTHAVVPGAKGGAPGGPTVTSHYVVAWGTGNYATLGPWDLYPAPASSSPLAVRQHVIKPTGAAQWAGCSDGQPAVPSCITTVPAGSSVIIPATGTSDPSLFSLTSVYEQVSNGAYFLGDLSKFVHVSPQQFEYVTVAGSGEAEATTAVAGEGGAAVAAAVPVAATPGRAGLLVGLRGTAGQAVTLGAVDPAGIVSIVTVTVPASGFVEVGL